jgi:hypothetical protein
MALGIDEDDIFVVALPPYAVGVSQGVRELCRELPHAGFGQVLVLRVGGVGSQHDLLVGFAYL